MATQTALGVYLSYIDEVLVDLGEDSQAIFRDAKLSYPDYIQPGERIDLASLNRLIVSIRSQCRTPEFFLILGERIPVMAHGNLGNAVMASENVERALAMVERYAAIVMPAVRVSFQREQTSTVVEYQVATPHEALNQALVEALITSTSYNFSALTGASFYPEKVEVAFKAPAYAKAFRHYTRCEVSFSAATNRFVFTRKALDLVITTRNPLSEKFLARQCEEELKRLKSQTDISERIREIISLYLDQSPGIDFVAEKLNLSERTLRRRLNEEGVNYRDLLKQIRHSMALHYLEKTDLRIEHIAWQLGYRETANFRKAFKLQEGVSPREWRKAHSGSGPSQ